MQAGEGFEELDEDGEERGVHGEEDNAVEGDGDVAQEAGDAAWEKGDEVRGKEDVDEQGVYTTEEGNMSANADGIGVTEGATKAGCGAADDVRGGAYPAPVEARAQLSTLACPPALRTERSTWPGYPSTAHPTMSARLV